MYATISADIVSSTSLSMQETIDIKKGINELFTVLEDRFPDFWGRQIKGDYIECLMTNVSDVLRVALLLKTYIKSFPVSEDKKKRLFHVYGVRLAIGIGSMRIVNHKEGIMDGEAIYYSGRALAAMKSPNKGTMCIGLKDQNQQAALNTILVLTDAFINTATKRQTEVLFYKLLGWNEDEISKKLNINQSAVNQHASSAKWYCIEQALNYFENLKFVGDE